MRNRRSAYALAAIVAALGFFLALRARRASAADAFPDILELAPHDATMIGYADVAALRGSPLVQRLVADAAPVQQDGDYQKFVAATGFDYQRDLDRVLMASRPSDAPNSALVFAQGRFDEKKIEAYALQSGKLQQENGRQVYVVPSSTPGKDVRFTFLSSGLIAFSAGGDLSAISAASSPAALDPAMRERLSRMVGSPVFTEIKATELTNRLSASAGSQMGVVTALLQSLRWVSVAARPDGDQVIVSTEGECDQPAQAQALATALEFARGILRGTLADQKTGGSGSPDSNQAALAMLQTVQITTEGARVRVLMNLTPDMLNFAAHPAPASH